MLLSGVLSENKLIIAAAGSGKTTYLVREALKSPDQNLLILTYTLSNEKSIKKIFFKEVNCIPKNITVKTWFTFLLQHGVKPYQGSFNESLFEQKINGMLFVSKASSMYCSEGKNFHDYYFTKDDKIYSDKISKFVFKCNEKSKNAVINRISNIYDCIFIDEIQDLAGYDLEILKILFVSPLRILITGDPRQVTYLTHNERKHHGYKDGKIKDFIKSEHCSGINCEIDEESLNVSHRNNQSICTYSGKLYPELPTPRSCECLNCRKITDHEGIFLVKKKDADYYLENYNPTQLRWNRNTECNENYPVMNFGDSKGLTFDRVFIYPTQKMISWIKDNNSELPNETRAKFYVGITRAKNSVGIVMDYKDDMVFDGLNKFSPHKKITDWF